MLRTVRWFCDVDFVLVMAAVVGHRAPYFIAMLLQLSCTQPMWLSYCVVATPRCVCVPSDRDIRKASCFEAALTVALGRG